ncbi:DgyrCDS11572 [Dimorphilus gyrociliatus]|uniref:DgyrCDS11572 n=1 Tax=Dimorphilus gyrociliatus TaxID=2664684 RepID=A0A7I8W4U0_9ANNE|nr:DgyrCDS11572 [Dimorphilus gyrociliatus]
MFGRGLWDYYESVSVDGLDRQPNAGNNQENKKGVVVDSLTAEEKNSRTSYKTINEIDPEGKLSQENAISDQEIWHRTNNFYQSNTTIFNQEKLTYRELFHWNSWRPCILNLVTSNGFSSFIMVIILLNTIILIMQTFEDFEIHAKWYLEGIDHVFGGIYLWELCLKVYVWRCGFFREKWNTLDFFIVLTNWLDILLVAYASTSNFNGATIFRLLRIFRAVRAIRAVRVLRTIRFLSNLQVLSLYSPKDNGKEPKGVWQKDETLSEDVKDYNDDSSTDFQPGEQDDEEKIRKTIDDYYPDVDEESRKSLNRFFMLLVAIEANVKYMEKQQQILDTLLQIAEDTPVNT